MKKNKLTHEQMNGMNWRYKKNEPPKEEFPDMNGEVKVVKPKKATKQSKDT